MTETTQPDPQVVACPGLTDREGTEDLVSCRLTAGHRGPHVPEPLTVADIPAGQGAASLAVVTREGGRREVVYKRADGHLMHLHTEPAPGATAADRTLWDHLAATLPPVTEETP